MGQIPKGFELEPEVKYQSMNQRQFTNQHEATRAMKPADKFEPGYDTIRVSSPQKARKNVLSPTG